MNQLPVWRLMELEDERQCFLDEGVYDVVNSICGHRPRESSMFDCEWAKEAGPYRCRVQAKPGFLPKRALPG